MCDVREKSCSSRKGTTNESVKGKEPLNVATVYWHYVQFIKEIGRLCNVAAFKQEVSAQVLLCANYGVV